MQYELDPFVSPGEIAIVIPGLPTFFETDYHTAELAAQRWAALLEAPDAIGTLEPEDIPEPGEPNPDIDSTPDTEGPSPMFAFTRTSMAIEAAMLRCRICDGAHFGWQCPKVRALLFTEDAPTAPQYELLAA